MNTSFIITVVGPDKPGLVNLLSEKTTAHGANWAESRMAALAGHFAGIVHLQVPSENIDALTASLQKLEAVGLRISMTKTGNHATDQTSQILKVELVGQDRPGIVRDISQVLAVRGISIEELDTDYVNGSWSGENLFRTKARLRLPSTVAPDDLRSALEGLANDLMVDLEPVAKA